MGEDLWFQCELRCGDVSQFQWVRYPSALVGNFFTIDRQRWEIVSIQFPGLRKAEIEARRRA